MISAERICKVLEGMCLVDFPVIDGYEDFAGKVYRWCHIREGSNCPHEKWTAEFLAMEKDILAALASPNEKRRLSNQVAEIDADKSGYC